MFNDYGVNFSGFNRLSDMNAKTRFAFRWLGARVKFKFFEQSVEGTVGRVDHLHKLIMASFNSNNKYIEVSGHYNCFRKI